MKRKTRRHIKNALLITLKNISCVIFATGWIADLLNADVRYVTIWFSSLIYIVLFGIANKGQKGIL